MKADNDESRSVNHMLRKIAKAEKTLKILKDDKVVLTAKMNTLKDRIRENRNISSFFYCTEDNETVANESSFYDSNHV